MQSEEEIKRAVENWDHLRQAVLGFDESTISRARKTEIVPPPSANARTTDRMEEIEDAGGAIFYDAREAIAKESGVTESIVEVVGATAYRTHRRFCELVLCPVILKCFERHDIDINAEDPKDIARQLEEEGIEVSPDDAAATPAAFPIMEFFEKTRDHFLDMDAYKRLTREQELRVWQVLALASRRKKENQSISSSGFAHFLSGDDARWWLTGVIAPDVRDLIRES